MNIVICLAVCYGDVRGSICKNFRQNTVSQGAVTLQINVMTRRDPVRMGFGLALVDSNVTLGSNLRRVNLKKCVLTGRFQ